MCNYLQDRQQRIKIKCSNSDFIKLDTGVPQGTIFDPLCFILDVNDMLNDTLKESIIFYADNTVLIAA